MSSRLNGKLVWHGRNAEDARRALVDSGKWEYIASGDGWFWVRYRADGSVVVEVQSAAGFVTGVDFIG